MLKYLVTLISQLVIPLIVNLITEFFKKLISGESQREKSINVHKKYNSFRGVVILGNTDGHKKVKRKILNAKKSIKIIAYFGDAIFNDLKGEIPELINKNGVKVKVLVSKDCKFLKEVKEMEEVEVKIKSIYDNNEKVYIDFLETIYYENTNKEPLPETVTLLKEKLKTRNEEEIIEGCKDSQNHIQKNSFNYIIDGINNKKMFELRPCTTQIRYTITIIDDKWAWWIPYHPGIITESSITFELFNKGEGSLFDLCNRHFDNLWYKCRDSKWEQND